MNTTEARSTETGQPTAGSGTDEDSSDSPNGAGSGSWMTRIGSTLWKVAGLRRNASASLRENLKDELARDSGADATFTPEERVLLGNILRLREVRVEDVMVPRADIEAVEETISLGRLMEAFRESGHSRMPVYRENLDDPRGMVHIKDLMAYFAERASAATRNGSGQGASGADGAKNGASQGSSALNQLDLAGVDLKRPLSEIGIIRPLLFVPPSMPATDLMTKMQAGRLQMALVIDEYGGTDGLVSLEDIVETVVGDIEDEHDEDEEPMIAAAGDNVWIADPRVLIEDLEQELGADFKLGELAEEVDTLGGLLFSVVGRVPARGELIAPKEIPGYEFEVLDADPRRIKRLRVRRRRVVDMRAVDGRRRPRRSDAAE